MDFADKKPPPSSLFLVNMAWFSNNCGGWYPFAKSSVHHLGFWQSSLMALPKGIGVTPKQRSTRLALMFWCALNHAGSEECLFHWVLLRFSFYFTDACGGPDKEPSGRVSDRDLGELCWELPIHTEINPFGLNVYSICLCAERKDMWRNQSLVVEKKWFIY